MLNRDITGNSLSVFTGILAFALALLFCESGSAQDTPEPGKRAFRIDITLPITSSSVQGIMRAFDETLSDANAHKDAKTVLIIRFVVPPDQKEHGRGSEFGACYDLGRHLKRPEFSAIDTYAFFPQSAEGHALLLAFSCRNIAIAEGAEIGYAGSDEPNGRLSKVQKDAYRDLFSRKDGIIEKIIDSASELLEVETEKGTQYLTREELAEVGKEQSIIGEPKVLKRSGEPGLFTADEARQIGLVELIAPDMIRLAEHIGIPPENLISKSYVQGHAVRIHVSGKMTPGKADEILRQIEMAINHRNGRVAFLCMHIESPGGSLSGSLNVANTLAELYEKKGIWTVAYVDRLARADAALMALACNELAIHPDAQFGGEGDGVFSDDEKDAAESSIAEMCRKAHRNWSLPLAIIDPRIEVHKMQRMNNPALIAYMCEKEAEEPDNLGKWTKGDVVGTPGQVFFVNGKEAVDYRLATLTVGDFNAFKKHYHIEDDPLLLEPNWVDKLARWLSNPTISGILLFVAFVAFWSELKTPGIGAGAFLAIICFGLFFWGKFLGGTAGWLEATLFCVGVILVLLEIFVMPGFGIFGVGGGVAIILSLVFASQTFIVPRNAYQFHQFRDSLLVLAVSGTGMIAIGYAAIQMLEKANRWKDSAENAVPIPEDGNVLESLLGASGKTMTPLLPYGKAVINGDPVNVISEDRLMIDANVAVRVVEIRGNNVIVREIEPA